MMGEFLSPSTSLVEFLRNSVLLLRVGYSAKYRPTFAAVGAANGLLPLIMSEAGFQNGGI
jgi:hypothetical protein